MHAAPEAAINLVQLMARSKKISRCCSFSFFSVASFLAFALAFALQSEEARHLGPIFEAIHGFLFKRAFGVGRWRRHVSGVLAILANSSGSCVAKRHWR